MVEILEQPDQLIVRIGGQEYTRYQFHSAGHKPFLYPLRAANGLSLVADSPTDHRHHHGIWIGHGRVNESDFWLERHNSGKIVQTSYTLSASSGESASVTVLNDWIDAAGTVQLRDERVLTFYDSPPEARWFDLKVTLRAPGEEAVLLYPTNEAGLPHVRAADGLTVKSGGTLINAEGKMNERGTYRQHSAWMDCSGKLGRLECGLAVFDHPENPDYPTRWFTRDYGPFAPNYGFFDEDPIEIRTDSPLVLRYRIYTHSGSAAMGGVAEAFDAYQRESQAGSA